MWPEAKCGNRGRRTRLQRRLGRLRRGFGSGSPVAGVADPGAARSLQRSLIRPWRRAPRRTFLRTFLRRGCEEADSDPCFEGCGPKANGGNRGRRTRLQRRLGRLDGAFSYPGIESRSKPKKTRHGSVPCLVYGRSKDLGFQTTARAFQTEQRQAEQSNGRAAFWNSGAVSRSIEPAVDFVS